jgi:glycosidase
MGVEILWFMPIHPISKVNRKGTLGSYYAVADYKAVNPEYGTLEEFKSLVKECHKMGFKVILDWVANHTGWDNQWVNNNPEFYTQINGKIIHPAGTNWTDVADLNYDNKQMREEMLDAMKFWVKEVDVDGYRCDYATGAPKDFWEEARSQLDKIKPVYMLAEDDSKFDFLDKAFHSNYSWSLLKAINNTAQGNGSISSIKQDLKRIPAIYPEGTFPMNFITNHDENSWNGTEYERLGDAVEVMNALIFTAPGIPLIYSGQEAALNKRLAFFEKDEIDWSNLSMQDFFKKLINLKKENKALWNGKAGGIISFIEASDESVLAYVRENNNNKVIFIANLSEKDVTAICELADYKGTYIDAFSNKELKLEENTQFELKSWEYMILTKK